MNDTSRRRYEMQQRVTQFGIDNAADFPAFVTGKMSGLSTLVGEVSARSAAQQSGMGEASQQYEVKSTAREDLRDQMSVISRTAKSMEYEFDGISDKFLFRRNLADADLLAKAMAFHSESAAYQADFVTYGMEANFRADLLAAANAFEASFAAVDSATAEHIAARADIEDRIHQGMIIVRTIDGPIRNIYANNPGKLAAWIAAQHVEKAPKKKGPELPTP